MMICTLRGTPFLYYGQELGLPDAEVPPERLVDVDGRDPERAPMPWRRPSQAGPGAGFTTAEPWLPVVAAAEGLCVEAQEKDPASMLSFMRGLVWLRAREPALQSGSQVPVSAGPEVLCFERRGNHRFLVALNFSSRRVPLGLSDEAGIPSAGALVDLSTHPGRGRDHIDPRDLVLGPDEGVILRLR
jgi:alpha-glucosidase